jgi:hypothetical protein
MRKGKVLLLICGLLISVFLPTSCKPVCDSEASFLTTVGLSPENDINRSMKMRYLNGQKTDFKAGDYLRMGTPIMELKHPFKLVANANSYYYKFEKEKCEWLPIQNMVVEINPDIIIYPSESNLEGRMLMTSNIMDPEAITKPTKVRVFFIGYYLNDAGQVLEPVAAFKDVTIYP